MYSNGENNVEQVKKNKGTIIFVAILFLALFAIVGYGGWQLSLNNKSENKLSDKAKEDKEEIKEIYAPTEEVKEDEEVVPLKNEKYTFYKEVKKYIELNGKDISLLFYYYLDKENYKSGNQGVYVDKEYNVLRREVFVSGKKITDVDIVLMVEEENKIDSYFNDKIYDMKSFKSLDDVDYLILFLADDNHLLLENNIVMPHYSYAEYAYIISDKGEVLKNILDRDPNFILQGISLKEEQFKTMNYVYYSDMLAPDENGGFITLYNVYIDSYLDVNENYVYYITGGCNGFTEYKLTIDKGIISEEKINTYTGDSVNGVGNC